MVLRVDAHQHFWNPARGDYGWLTPERMRLHRAFGPKELRPLLTAAGFQGTVVIQAAPTVAETEYLLGIADACDEVLGVVGWVDFENPEHLHELDRIARHPLLKGIRPMIQDIAETGWMLRPELAWAFRAMIAHDLAFDALVQPRHLQTLLALLHRHPGLRAVIDHAGKPEVTGGLDPAWAGAMAALARETSALVKLSGLVTQAGPGWEVDDLQPIVDHLLETFGPGRILFGSDWPVLTLRSEYQRWVDAAEELTEACAAGERLALFGGNAVEFYRLSPP
jgi:L-fuconolactonase